MLLIIGFLFMLFIFVGMSALTGTGFMFIDLPSAFLILISLLFFWFASKSGSVIGRYMKTSFKKDYTYTKTELAALSAALKNTGKFILAVGGFGFISGMLASMANLENREMLGPNLAVSMLTLLYGITIGVFVFLPAQAWAENKLNTLQDNA